MLLTFNLLPDCNHNHHKCKHLNSFFHVDNHHMVRLIFEQHAKKENKYNKLKFKIFRKKKSFFKF